MSEDPREQAWRAEDESEESAQVGSRTDVGTTAADAMGDTTTTRQSDQTDAGVGGRTDASDSMLTPDEQPGGGSLVDYGNDDSSPVDPVSRGLAEAPPS